MFKFSRFGKFIAGMRGIKLLPEEKRDMRNAVLAYMEAHPVRTAKDNRQLGIGDAIRSPFTHYVLKPMPIALIIALVLGVGTSAAAETSLPGNPLYSVKVHFNEPVRAALTVKADAKASWDARIAERRLEEAAELQAQGQLNAETRAQLERRFAEYAKRAEDRIDALRDRVGEERAAEIAARLEISLRAHEAALERMTADGTIDRRELQLFLGMVKNHKEKAKNLREKIEVEITAQGNSATSTPEEKSRGEAAARARLQAAQKAIERAEAFVDRNRDKVSAEVIARADAQLKIAQTKITEGRAHMQAQAFGRAFVSFQDAFRVAKDVQIFILRNDDDDQATQATTTLQSIIKVRPNNGRMRVKIENEGDLKIGL